MAQSELQLEYNGLLGQKKDRWEVTKFIPYLESLIVARYGELILTYGCESLTINKQATTKIP